MGGSSILRTLPDKIGEVFNLLYEFQAFITRLSLIFLRGLGKVTEICQLILETFSVMCHRGWL
jgi:hypothetical protein